MEESVRRRRRVRSAPSPATASATTSAASSTAEETWAPADPVPAAVPLEGPNVERGLRGLVGGGSSQVSPSTALRARDAARPRPEDLARAETELAIIRRNWAPRE
jgi:hypothetical protein